MKLQSIVAMLILFVATSSQAQSGKYFQATGTKCKIAKVYIDQRVADYCSSTLTATWTGGCKDGYAEGKGKLTCVSKVPNRTFTLEFEGTLVKGKKEGYGVLEFYQSYSIFNPAYTYKGSFKADEFDGYGEFESKVEYPPDAKDVENKTDISVTYGLNMPAWRTDLYFVEFKGKFSKGKIADTENASGKTRLMQLLAAEVYYSGGFKNGLPNGKGVATETNSVALPNGKTNMALSGNFVNGFVTGNGTYTGREFEYTGELKYSMPQGKGSMKYYEWSPDQPGSVQYSRKLYCIVEGEFQHGSANGQCTIQYQNSAAFKYTGMMKNGQMDGTGELEFLNGSKFRGYFVNGLIEGEGAIQFANGDKFTGMYENDKPVKGVFYYTDGTQYEGQVTVREENDKITGKPTQVYIRQGKGLFTDKDHTKYAVTCENGNCTKD